MYFLQGLAHMGLKPIGSIRKQNDAVSLSPLYTSPLPVTYCFSVWSKLEKINEHKKKKNQSISKELKMF